MIRETISHNTYAPSNEIQKTVVIEIQLQWLIERNELVTTIRWLMLAKTNAIGKAISNHNTTRIAKHGDQVMTDSHFHSSSHLNCLSFNFIMLATICVSKEPLNDGLRITLRCSQPKCDKEDHRFVALIPYYSRR